jgi:hypothetical protein
MSDYTIYEMSKFLNLELEARHLKGVTSQMMYSYANAKKPQFTTFTSDSGQQRITEDEMKAFITKFVKNRINGKSARVEYKRLEGLEID